MSRPQGIGHRDPAGVPSDGGRTGVAPTAGESSSRRWAEASARPLPRFRDSEMNMGSWAMPSRSPTRARAAVGEVRLCTSANEYKPSGRIVFCHGSKNRGSALEVLALTSRLASERLSIERSSESALITVADSLANP
jgi:hypothetical protein